VVEGDQRLFKRGGFNLYGGILANPAKPAHAKKDVSQTRIAG